MRRCSRPVVARGWVIGGTRPDPPISGWSERKPQRRVDEDESLFRMNFSSAFRSHSLADRPNLSFVLVEELRRVGIYSCEDLEQATALGAWHRLCTAGIRHETHVLLALEGAIQGIAWQSLPITERHALLRLAQGR